MQTWVFAEAIDGAPGALALEMLTKARSFEGDLAAVYVGEPAEEAVATLGAHGATTVYSIDPGDSLPAAGITAALAGLVEEHAPDLILFGLGYTDRDVAGRLSARLDRPVLAGAIDLAADDGSVTVTSEILGGTVLVDSVFEGPAPWIAVVRPKSFTAEPAGAAMPEVVPVSMGDAGHAGSASILERIAEPSSGPVLEDADIVVAGGRGMGSEANFALVTDLAETLGGAIGATRAVVDAGWVPYSLQIGQTGKTVKPNLYFAAGLSGAMQHVVGMKDSGTIIAVNKDEEAPIFGLADLGIVGDINKVLPKLLEALKARG
jgi:electron transfer flavoprotein alpha subunit